MRFWITLALAIGLVSCTRTPTAVIYVADSIITMEEPHARAEAIAVVDGKIKALGSLQEVRASLGGYEIEENYQFKDKVIMPGFIEPHLHPYIAGILLPMKFITPHNWNMPGKQSIGVKSEAEYLAALQQHESQMDDGEWLWSWGYHHYFHGQLSREKLDAISSERPIFIWHRSFHEIYVNSAALKSLELEDNDHPQVDYAKGHFFENGLYEIIPKINPELSDPFRYLGALKQARKIIHAGGITTVGDGAFGTLDFDKEYQSIWFSSWNRDASPFRYMILPDGKAIGKQLGNEAALAFIENLTDKDTDRITVHRKQVKLFADGAAYSQLMQLSEDYLDGHHGEWLMTPEKLEEAAWLYWLNDYQIHIHVNGDLALDNVMNMVERFQKEHPRQDHRLTIHHFAYARTDQAERLKQLGILVQANPYYVWALANKYSEVGLGKDRAHAMVPLRSLHEQGVNIALHSDFTMAPAQPLLLAWAAVTRTTSEGNTVGEEHRLPLHEALKAITINAAFQMQMEESIGSLAVGKNADFTILEQDPYQVPEEQLKDIPIWGTVLEGEIFAVKD